MPDNINETKSINNSEPETITAKDTVSEEPIQEYGDVVIRLSHVTKQFKLFKSKRSRLWAASFAIVCFMKMNASK